MRSLVFFDLPVTTKKQRRAYAKFVKSLKKEGFVMMQESVYAKMDMDDRAAESTKNAVNKFLPKEGLIFLLKITEKQFASIQYLLGESTSDVVNSVDRLIEL